MSNTVLSVGALATDARYIRQDSVISELVRRDR